MMRILQRLWQLILELFARLPRPFKAKDRRSIFRYWNGKKWTFADPIAVLRSINNDPDFSYDKHWLAAVHGNVDDVGIVAKAVYQAFNATPLDDKSNGLTEAECVNLLADFLYYCEEVKKNTSSPQTTTQSTDEINPEMEITSTS
jgi:glutamate/tyrosine decarboxylase-like PLP-dependent enzyme